MTSHFYIQILRKYTDVWFSLHKEIQRDRPYYFKNYNKSFQKIFPNLVLESATSQSYPTKFKSGYWKGHCVWFISFCKVPPSYV